MRKKTGCFVLAFLGSLFLAGCSENSKVQIVEPKRASEEEGIQAGSKSVKEQVQAPKEGVHMCYQNADAVVTVDAPIFVPDVEGIKIKRVVSRSFTEEELKKLEEVVLDGGVVLGYKDLYGEAYEDETRAAMGLTGTENAEAQSGEGAGAFDAPGWEAGYEEAFSFEKLSETAIKYLENKEEGTLLELEELLRAGESLYGDSDNENAVSKLTDWQDKYFNVLSIPGFTEGVELTDLPTHISRLKEYRQDFAGNLVIGRDDWYYLEYEKEFMEGFYDVEALSYRRDSWWEGWIGTDNLFETSYSEKNRELLEKCDQLIERLGWENVVKSHSRKVNLLHQDRSMGDGNFSNTREGIKATYTRVVDKIPITVTDQGGNLVYWNGNEMSWLCEKIEVIYDEEGLQSFIWVNPQTITTMEEENVFLLPFSEIREIFEEMMNTILLQEGVYGEFWIDEIRLGYMRIGGDSTEQGDGLLVPVWDFIGNAPIDEYGAENLGQEAGSRISYMTINAMDGSIIMRG